MKLDHETMLAKMFARDADADGRFVTGVMTTGIFCLPSCSARKPKAENVEFFATPLAAKAAGLRPCRRCRPELFYRGIDPDLELVSSLARAVAERPSDFRNARQLVETSGVGASKLHALFRSHWHTTPAEMLTRHRIDLVCKQLIETKVPIAELAFEVGFESLSSFHRNFRNLVRMTPSDYRRLSTSRGEQLGFRLELPANFQTEAVCRYLTRDAKSPSETMAQSKIRLTRTICSRVVDLELSFARDAVDCHWTSDGPWSATDGGEIHRVVTRLLGLTIDPNGFESRACSSSAIARLVAGRRGLSIPQTADFFEALVWVIAGQQVSLPVAFALRRRLTRRLGRSGGPGGHGGISPPSADRVAELSRRDLRDLGFSVRKSEYLSDIARSIADGQLQVDEVRRSNATVVAKRLLSIRGLGDWSTQYLMMRALGFVDCVPAGDVVLQRKLGEFLGLEHRPDAHQVRKLMQPFAPYRSLASFHLWSWEPGSSE